MRALSSSTRRLNSSRVLIIGSIRWVRRPSSSIRRTARRRRRPSRRHAARRWADRPRLARGQVVVVVVALQSVSRGAQIEGQPAEDLVLFQLVGHRDLHRAVEGQLALVDPPQHLDGQLHHVVAGQHVAAELGAGPSICRARATSCAASRAGSRPSASGTCAPDRPTTSRPRRRCRVRRRPRWRRNAPSSSNSSTAYSSPSSISRASWGFPSSSIFLFGLMKRDVVQIVQQCICVEQSSTP